MPLEFLDLRERMSGFMAGVVSGCTKLVVGHPFDTIKVRLQTEGGHGRFRGVWDCVRQTAGREGFRAFYKGATPPLFGWALMDSVMLGSLTNFKRMLREWNAKSYSDSSTAIDTSLSYKQHALAGLGSGIVVSFVATPVENVKARLQTQYSKSGALYSGPIDCIQKILQQRGLVGLYRGLVGCLVFRSFFAVLWSSYEFYTRLFEGLSQQPNSWMPSSMVSFFAGGMAANTFWVIAFPADVVKNRMMSQPETTPLRYPTFRSCVRTIIKEEGLRGFFRGFTPCILRSFPTNGAAYFMFDTCMRWMSATGNRIN